MKNRNRIIAVSVVILVAVIAICFGIYFYLKADRLTVKERKWLDSTSKNSQVININVLNNADIFGSNGSGIFFSFLDDFAKKYGLNINKVTYDYGTETSGLTLGVKTTTDKFDTILYEDHYVLLSKTYEQVNNFNSLSDRKIGVLARDFDYVLKFLNNDAVVFNKYETKEELVNSTDDFIMLPLHLYLKEILNKDLNIIYHFSDIKMYYTLRTNDDTLSGIIVKYYNSWKKNFNNLYDKELFSLLTKSLSVSATDIEKMQNETYNYGFINNSPYEVISGGNYGGIIAIYLKEFNKMANIDMRFTRYRSYAKFIQALNSDKIDLYFSHYGETSNFIKTVSGIKTSYVVVANNANSLVVNSLSSLVGLDVYVERNSLLHNYINSIGGLNIKTYDNVNELLKMNNKDNIIILDASTFDYYHYNGLNNYTVRYTEPLNFEYHFAFKENDAFFILFSKYIMIVDSNRVYNDGIYDHARTMWLGNLFTSIAKYFILLLVIIGLGYLIHVRNSKKVTISKKIKKDDTIRFIDQLTLLKNRNYLAENIKEWGKNTIYPQAVVVMDLNQLQTINDIEGYEEGDRQIKAAANVLIKTQLDNSDIIRTDGNEFVVYLVGYSQKQLTNYIHKLNKELKKLPYNYGAEFGYSMILDDIKTIEDALNEATKALKKQKELNEDKI